MKKTLALVALVLAVAAPAVMVVPHGNAGSTIIARFS
jgi:hypothetical protein